MAKRNIDPQDKGIRYEREDDGALQVYLDGRHYAWFSGTHVPMLQGREVSEAEYLAEVTAIYGISPLHAPA